MTSNRRSRTAPAAEPGSPASGSVRDRILHTASALFYREGIRAVGVDTVVERSGVAKTSLYRWFPSKDDLVGAYTSLADRIYWSRWDHSAARHGGDARAQLDAVLAGVARHVRHEEFRGCAFLNVAAEFPDPAHPARRVAYANKMELRARLTALARELGASHPASLADQLYLLIEGTLAAVHVLGADAPIDALPAAARALVDAAVGTAPPPRGDSTPDD